MKTILAVTVGILLAVKGEAQYRSSYTGTTSGYSRSSDGYPSYGSTSRSRYSATKYSTPSYSKPRSTQYMPAKYYNPRSDPRFKDNTYRPYHPSYVRYSDRHYYPQYRLYGLYTPATTYQYNRGYSSVYSGYYPYYYSQYSSRFSGYNPWTRYTRGNLSATGTTYQAAAPQALYLGKSGDRIITYTRPIVADSTAGFQNYYATDSLNSVRINDPSARKVELVSQVANLFSDDVALRNQYVLDKHNDQVKTILRYVKKYNKDKNKRE